MILVIGATGVLGRPVVRSLLEAGFPVRVCTRDVVRARRVLPDAVTIMRGDLRDAASLDRVMDGVQAAYLNLSHPYAESDPYDAVRDGTPAVIAAARRTGLPRLLSISALEVPEARDDWWIIERKHVADERLLESGLATVFRPTWFMESLPLFVLGPALLAVTGLPQEGLSWIAGEDYGRQVVAALRDDGTSGRAWPVEGPEAVGFAEAIARFRAALPRRLVTVPTPLAALRLGRGLHAKTRYLVDLLDVTFRCAGGFRSSETWSCLGRPTTTIEGYVASIARTGDWPHKPAFG